jgi:hypothetical protein
MSYTINYTNGGTLMVLPDQTYDNQSTSLTLVGKNSNAYGSAVNNNFVHLLENFANVTSPTSPMVGQLWFDTIAGQVKVYNNQTWKSVGAPTISASQPSTLITGDFWYDTTNTRLWYYNGIDLVNLSTQYNSSEGKSGAIFETVVDILNNIWPVINFYVNGSLLGWFANQTVTLNQSANPTFTGITNTIRPGLTLNSVNTSTYFNGTATSALSIAGFSSSMSSALANLLNGGNFATTSSLIIQGTQGITVNSTGSTGILQIFGTGSNVLITNNTPNGTTNIGYNNNSSGYGVGISVNGSNKSVTLGGTGTYPGYTIAAKGDMVIDGNLTVLGTSQELITSNLFVQSKNIYLSTGSTTDIGSGGAGIAIGGTNPATGDASLSINLLYNPYLADTRGKGGWQMSRSLNLYNSQDGFYISGNKVLDANGLYISTITNVTNFSVSATITVGQLGQDFLTLTTGSISANGPLKISTGLSPNNYIDVNYASIVNSIAPNLATTSSTVTNAIVVNKGYVDTAISLATGGNAGRKPYTLNVDITGFTNVNQSLINILNQVLPVNGGDINYYAQPAGSRCSILCATYSATTATFVLNLSQNQIPYVYTTSSFNTSTNTTTTFINTTTLDTFVAGNVTVTGPLPTVTYSTKLFEVIQIGVSVPSQVVATYITGTFTTSSGCTITLNSAGGISAGAFMTGNGFSSSQMVVEVLNTNTILVNKSPDTTPSVGGQIQFAQQAGFNGWVYIRDVAY